MPTGPKGQKRPADVIGNAVKIARIATGEDSDDTPAEALLAEQWFAFMHKVIGGVQHAFRESGLSQVVIAKRLGKKNPEVISRCLSGQRNMTLRTLHDLARAMGYRLDITVTPINSLKPSNRPRVTDPAPVDTTSRQARRTRSIRA